MLKRLLLIGVFLSCACAPSIKENAIKAAQVAHVSAGQAQQAEISVYEAKLVPTFTLDKHQAFHRAFIEYVDAENKFLDVLQAWRAGDAPPSDLKTAITALQTASKVLGDVSPTALSTALSFVNSALSALQQVATLTTPR